MTTLKVYFLSKKKERERSFFVGATNKQTNKQKTLQSLCVHTRSTRTHATERNPLLFHFIFVDLCISFLFYFYFFLKKANDDFIFTSLSLLTQRKHHFSTQILNKEMIWDVSRFEHMHRINTLLSPMKRCILCCRLLYLTHAAYAAPGRWWWWWWWWWCRANRK